MPQSDASCPSSASVSTPRPAGRPRPYAAPSARRSTFSLKPGADTSPETASAQAASPEPPQNMERKYWDAAQSTTLCAASLAGPAAPSAVAPESGTIQQSARSGLSKNDCNPTGAAWGPAGAAGAAAAAPACWAEIPNRPASRASPSPSTAWAPARTSAAATRAALFGLGRLHAFARGVAAGLALVPCCKSDSRVSAPDRAACTGPPGAGWAAAAAAGSRAATPGPPAARARISITASAPAPSSLAPA
mmetsp:Transcript_14717/g.55474  ORF Transcript_14717/g.55474 Transcript_14717/m.55474 type:complete len:248 (-) Transcript_14717:1967-2710(-)